MKTIKNLADVRKIDVFKQEHEKFKKEIKYYESKIADERKRIVNTFKLDDVVQINETYEVCNISESDYVVVRKWDDSENCYVERDVYPEDLILIERKVEEVK